LESAINRAIAVPGPRQVGKTTLAKAIAKKRAGAIYLDLENPLDKQKLEDAYSYLHSLSNSCIILDEVQLKPDLFSI